MSDSYFKLIEPLHRNNGIYTTPDWLVTAGFVNTFQIFISVLVLISIIIMCVLLANTTSAPSPPSGAYERDYDALQGTRSPLLDLSGIDLTTPMINYSVLTANFGGIFTESPTWLSPWNGTVSPDAATLQVEAGARAIVLDIWPNPADMSQPVVCAMMDLTQHTIQKWWLNNGLNKNVHRYSNWNAVTRNTAPVGDILRAAINAAFASPTGKQNGDPFFLILKLHGAMTLPY